jgi:Tfp pilus assembly protein PilX
MGQEEGKAMNHRRNPRNSERGVALILVLLVMLVLVTLAAAVIFVTQTQVWTNLNYRLTSQARYAAEAGIQRTMNWFINSYTAPTSTASYTLTTNPVQYNGSAVVLSGVSGVHSNYPTSTVSSAYNAALSSQSIPGLSGASFSTYATLLRMSGGGGGVSWLGGSGNGGVAQTWQITSQGNISGISGIPSAQVQVVGTFERSGTPIFIYGLAGDSTGCPAVSFTNGTMNSWNSANGTYAATHQSSGATIASNGNVTLSGGSTAIDGIIYSDLNTTIGSSCSDGVTNSSGSTPTVKTISQALAYAAPAAPSPMTPTANVQQNGNSSCDASWPAGACTFANASPPCAAGYTPCFEIAPSTSSTLYYGNLTANQNIVLSAGTYYFNSFQMNGGSVSLASTPVVLNLGGNGIGSGNTLFQTNSNVTVNDFGIPANLQVVSACCLSGSPPAQMANPPTITMNSSSSMYAVVYAPNAYVHITGSSQFLGAVISQTIKSDSSGGFSFDQGLLNSLATVGNFVPVNFSWSKF